MEDEMEGLANRRAHAEASKVRRRFPFTASMVPSSSARKWIISSDIPDAPYRTDSVKVEATPFFTLSSQTPSQFHSPGSRTVVARDDVILLASDSAASPRSLPVSLVVSPLNMLSRLNLYIFLSSTFSCLRRCVRHACQAPGFPAAERGTASRTSALSNVLRMYFNRE